MTKRSGYQLSEDKQLDNSKDLNDEGTFLIKEAVEKLESLQHDEVALQKELTWQHTW